ncbi:hypothetical protein B5F76_04190 [Desulfovibrio sp. An276]|nr:hypothetical protein B5F76_04190 [Desulfovibrio sp. An276]
MQKKQDNKGLHAYGRLSEMLVQGRIYKAFEKSTFCSSQYACAFCQRKRGKKDGLLDAGQAKRQKGIQEDRGSLKHFFAVNF